MHTKRSENVTPVCGALHGPVVLVRPEDLTLCKDPLALEFFFFYFLGGFYVKALGVWPYQISSSHEGPILVTLFTLGLIPHIHFLVFFPILLYCAYVCICVYMSVSTSLFIPADCLWVLA